MSNTRLERGQEIADKPNQVVRINEKSYIVKSQTTDSEYEILESEMGWICSCPDHMYRGVTCKHIYSVELSQNLRKIVETQIVISEIANVCPQCKCDQIVKHGIRHNKYGDIQRYSCLNCNKRFTNNTGFEKMRATPQIITSAMQLYFTGESFRNVQKFLRLQGVNVSHMAVYKWINKYVGLMQKYLDTIKPNVSNVWRTDELYLKLKGNNKFLFALMDAETRFWIAQQIADKKYSSDIRMMFRKGMEIAGKKPTILISDGANNIVKAYKKEYWTRAKEKSTKHIRHVRFQGDAHNNKMERLSGEIRVREKTMRELKNKDTPILSGYQIFHNYIREHGALDGKAEKCGIKIEGKNKWFTLIQNSSHKIN